MTATPGAAPPPAQRVARNTALRAGAEILGKLATLGLTVVIARELGLAAVAQYGFALTVSQLYWPIAGFGLDRLMLKEVAVDSDRAAFYIPRLNAFKLGIGLLCTIVGTLLITLRGDEVVTQLVLILGLTLVATLVGSTAQNVFMAHERMQDFFVAALPVKVLSALIGITIVLAGGSIVLVALGALAASLVGVAIGWLLLSRRYGEQAARLSGRPSELWPMARTSGPWGLQEVFGQITFRLGFLVLFLVADEATAGGYRVAYQLLEATLFLPWSIGTSVLPLIARAKRGAANALGEPTLEAVARGAVELTVALMLPISLVLALCAEPILRIVDEPATIAAGYLPLLALASVVYGVGHIAGLVALAHLPGRRTVVMMIQAASLSVLFVAFLVPTLGAEGAAIAALLTEVSLTLLSIRLAAGVGAGSAGMLPRPWTPLVPAGLVMALVLWPLRSDLILAALAGGLAYVAVLLPLEYRRNGPAGQMVRSVLARAR